MTIWWKIKTVMESIFHLISSHTRGQYCWSINSICCIAMTMTTGGCIAKMKIFMESIFYLLSFGVWLKTVREKKFLRKKCQRWVLASSLGRPPLTDVAVKYSVWKLRLKAPNHILCTNIARPIVRPLATKNLKNVTFRVHLLLSKKLRTYWICIIPTGY